MTRALALCLALSMLAACGGPTAIMVTVDTREGRPLTPGEDFDRLRVQVHTGGSLLFERTVGMTDRTFPQTIGFTPGPESERAVLTVQAEALHLGDVVVTRASRDVRFQDGQVVQVELELVGP